MCQEIRWTLSSKYTYFSPFCHLTNWSMPPSSLTWLTTTDEPRLPVSFPDSYTLFSHQPEKACYIENQIVSIYSEPSNDFPGYSKKKPKLSHGPQVPTYTKPHPTCSLSDLLSYLFPSLLTLSPPYLSSDM